MTQLNLPQAVFLTLTCMFIMTAFRAPVTAQEFDKTIAGYADVATRIIESAREENGGYLKLQELCDDIGARLSGSPELDQAIEWAQAKMKEDGHANVHGEKVMVPHWVRGDEWCKMNSPREMDLQMLGLGGSVGTNGKPLKAEVIVVASKDALDELADEDIKGKIVVFNFPMRQFSPEEGSGYGDAVAYRGSGATWAAERGGLAALVRSCTAYSLTTPHTGMMRKYSAEVEKVPAAAITIEAAMLLDRLQKRGKTPTVTLYMEAENKGETPSANVIGEIVGSEKPEEIVVIGGHIDSWDVGQGAQDDGGGCCAAMEALTILRKLNLQPKRTIRVVLWTNEESGAAGAKSYAARHAEEIHVAGIESDSGIFRPEGLSIDMEDDNKELIAAKQLQSIVNLLEPIGATRATTGYSGVDIGFMKQFGTACMGLNVDGRFYFNTHHTEADTVDKINPDDLTDCAISLAVSAYILADMPGRLGDE